MTEETRELTVPPAAAGRRLDVFLSEALSGVSRSQVQRLVQDGHVSVDGRPAPVGRKLRGGEDITVEMPLGEPIEFAPEAIPLETVYEDDWLLVINKPPGLVVHPGAGHHSGTLVNALLARGVPLSNMGDPARPGIVHRLDKDTSGLLLVAKDNSTHHALARMLKDRRISRRYLALIWGDPKQQQFTIDAAIGRKPSRRMQMAVISDPERPSRDARTDVSVLERFGEISLVEATLSTGRTHQVRVHLAYVGHPVVGDPAYGVRVAHGEMNRLDGFTRQLIAALPGQALHAYRLAFPHPTDDRPMEFRSDPPEAFAQLLAHLRFRDR